MNFYSMLLRKLSIIDDGSSEINVFCNTKEELDDLLSLYDKYGVKWNAGQDVLSKSQKAACLDILKDDKVVVLSLNIDNRITRGKVYEKKNDISVKHIKNIVITNLVITKKERKSEK